MAKMGRPKVYNKPRQQVNIQLSADTLAWLETITNNRSAFIEGVINELREMPVYRLSTWESPDGLHDQYKGFYDGITENDPSSIVVTSKDEITVFSMVPEMADCLAGYKRAD